MQHLTDLFSDYRPPEELAGVVRSAELLGAQIDANARRVTAQLRLPQYATIAQLEELQTGLARQYGIGQVTLEPQFDPACVEQMPSSELTEVIRRVFAPARSILAGCKWARTEDGFAVTLRQNGKDQLQPQLRHGEAFLNQRFGGCWKLSIAGSHEMSHEELEALSEQIRREAMQSVPAVHFKEAEKKEKPADNAIYGRPFRAITTPLRELDIETDKVTVEGEVFAVNHK